MFASCVMLGFLDSPTALVTGGAVYLRFLRLRYRLHRRRFIVRASS